MARNICPVCHRDVWDHAYSCPHFGRATVGSQVKSGHLGPWPTKLGRLEKHNVAGFFALLGSTLLAGIGFAMMHAFPLPGIAMFLGGGYCFGKANEFALGVYNVTCPHCGRSGSMKAAAKTYRCPVCEKESVKADECLRPVK